MTAADARKEATFRQRKPKLTQRKLWQLLPVLLWRRLLLPTGTRPQPAQEPNNLHLFLYFTVLCIINVDAC